MSNETSFVADGQLSFDGVESPHAGLKIAHAREKAGLTLAELSNKLKVNERKLELIERGEFAQISGGHAHVRGLVRAMCKAVGLDPDPVLAQMPAFDAPHPLVDIDSRHAAPFTTSERMGKQGYGAPSSKGHVNAKSRGLSALLSNPLTLGAAIAVLAAGVMYIWPVVQEPVQLLWQKTGLGATAQTVEKTITTPEVAAGAATQNDAVTTQPVPLKPANEITSAVLAPAQAASQPLPASDSTTVALAPATIDPTKLTIEAREPTWIEVRGLSGTLLVSRNLTPGERLEQGLENRRSVKVGNAAATQVWVRGKEFDITALARNNVARFDVQ